MLAMSKEPAVSPLTIRTPHRGPFTVTEDQLTTFVTPLLGFPGLTRWFIHQIDDGPRHWMQSVDDRQIGFCLFAPFQAGLDLDLEVGNDEVAALGAEDVSDIDVYTMVVLDRDPARHRTNLRAPILVCRHTARAKQVVLHDTRLPVRFLLPDLKPIGR